MSFGWSAGDIATAISVLLKVSKALKISGGAATSYQSTASFLTSLSKTLSSLQNLLSQNPSLSFKDDIAHHAILMKNAVEEFENRIKKYDLSLGEGSVRKKARSIPREVQFALLEDVKELRVAVTQPFLILEFWVNQQTL